MAGSRMATPVPNKISKRKTPVPVPDVASVSDDRLDHIEDPAERKRVLNVLAQRRYRRRKREHQLELEMQVNRQKQRSQSVGQVQDLSPTSDWDHLGSDRSESARELQYLRHRVRELEAALYAKSLDTQSAVPLTSGSDPFDAFGSTNVVEQLSASSESDQGTFSSEGMFGDWMLTQANGPPEVSSSSSISATLQPLPDIGDLLQSFTSTSYNFPDEANLSIPAFTLLRACSLIAQRLKVYHLLWDFTATSPFYGSTSIHHDLPSDIRPTITQITIPHHPMLDLIPWPKVRDRLISTFSMEEDNWPVHKSERLNVLRLVYDMENSEADGCEGIRVNGADAFDGSGWEAGQGFFSVWWWALDPQVVGRSNYWRSKRGDPTLKLGDDDVALRERGFPNTT